MPIFTLIIDLNEHIPIPSNERIHSPLSRISSSF